MRKLTEEEYLKRVHNAHGDNIIVLTPYINGRTPVEAECGRCGHRWLVLARTLYSHEMYKNGCADCGPGWTQPASLRGKRL